MTKKLLAILLSAIMMVAMSVTASAAGLDEYVPDVELEESSISGYYSGWVSPVNPHVSVPISCNGTCGVGITIVTSASTTQAIRVKAIAQNTNGSISTFIGNTNNTISTNGTYYFVDGITHSNDDFSAYFTFENLTVDMHVTIYIYG